MVINKKKRFYGNLRLDYHIFSILKVSTDLSSNLHVAGKNIPQVLRKSSIEGFVKPLDGVPPYYQANIHRALVLLPPIDILDLTHIV